MSTAGGKRLSYFGEVSAMIASRLCSPLRALPRQGQIIRAVKRQYADVADGKLQLSLVLPHQVHSLMSRSFTFRQGPLLRYQINFLLFVVLASASLRSN